MTGLTLGKFAPLHKGHQYLIEKALATVDHLVVIVYDAQEITDIPLGIRADWIRQLYPEVEVIEADDVPKDKGYTEAIQQKHERYIASLVAHRRIDKFFSSEPYGARMSKALGAENVVVDAERETYRISGTEIRRNPERYRAYLDDRVYEALLKWR